MLDPIWLNADEFFRDFGIFVLVLIGIVCLCGFLYGILFALFEHFFEKHTEILTELDTRKIVKQELDFLKFQQNKEEKKST